GMGGDFAQRRQFVSDAADGMAVDAVLDILKAAAESSQEALSHSLVRLLSKLAVHAEAGAAPVRPQADAALREQVQQLLAGWTLPDPTPGAYSAALQRMARAAPAGAPPRTDHHVTEPDRLVAMALEIGTMGPRLPAAVDRVVAEGRLAQLLDALEGGVADSAAAATVRARIATAAAVQQIVAREPIDFKLLERLVPLVGAAAAPPLLDALAAAESRGARRGLLAQLAKMGAEIAPFVIARLDDSRWYVTRNLLALLEELGPPPAGFSAAPYMQHADARVRWQAVKLQLKLPGGRDEALVAGLRDPDPPSSRWRRSRPGGATTHGRARASASRPRPPTARSATPRRRRRAGREQPRRLPQRVRACARGNDPLSAGASCPRARDRRRVSRAERPAGDRVTAAVHVPGR